eukprot:scaffold2926_cov109-Skeletonema_dohrnii-CCMP3373.AAC.4
MPVSKSPPYTPFPASAMEDAMEHMSFNRPPYLIVANSSARSIHPANGNHISSERPPISDSC